MQVQDAVKGIVMAPTASRQETLAAWDGDKRIISK